MRTNSITILFFIVLVAACATSDKNKDIHTSEMQDLEQEEKVDAMLQRDQERIDSMKRVLLNITDN
jgi:ABC-type Fe3+-citrate transport system substrate-binding protein